MTPESKARRDFIDRYQDLLFERIHKDQEGFFNVVFDYLADGLTLDGGNIKYTAKNLNLIRSMDDLLTGWRREHGEVTVKFFTESLFELNDLNHKYFDRIVKSTNLEAISRNVFRETMHTLGYDAKQKKILKKGFLHDLVTSPDPYNRIKAEATRAIAGRLDFTSFRRSIRDLIKGVNGGLGVLERHFYTHMYDAYAQFDRNVSANTAAKLELNHAIYQGGIIKTTRSFCLSRNNKAFTREEIESWKTLKFQGKPANYNPATDLGGYNCRHTLDWITEEMYKEITGKDEPAKPKSTGTEVKNEAYVPIAGVEEASKRAKEILEDFFGLKIENTLVASDLTVDELNLLLNQLHTLSRDYKSGNSFRVDKSTSLSFNSYDDGRVGFVSYMSNGLLKEANFGSTMYNDYIQLVRTKGRKQAQVNAQVDKDKFKQSTVVHEFAHFITTFARSNYQKNEHNSKFWKEVRKIRADYDKQRNKYKETGKDFSKFYLGDYADYNLSEFMAEAFTEYKLNSKPSKYAILIGKLIDKYYKRDNAD